MEEEIEKIENNKTWTLVLRPKDKNVIGIKWVYKKKLDENGEVTRNKERLVCKGYAQEEGINYGEEFAPVARLEGVRTLLSYSTYKGFKFYQMDVKFAFLNGILEEEVYIEQPEGFVNANNKKMVCRLHKALYGLKKAPRAWYERLHNYFLKIGFERIDHNRNLYLKIEKGKGILLSKNFVDDIIFGGQDTLCKAFANEMKQEFEMSMVGEIKLFVVFQVHQMKYGIYIDQSKHVKEILKTFGLEDSKLVNTPMVTCHKLSKNDDSAKVNQTLYRYMIAKLQYVVHSRPDVALSIGIVIGNNQD